jgi:DNA-binding IclR family transcriptional regulator
MKQDEPVDQPAKAQLSQLKRAFDAVEALVNATQPLKLTALSEVTRLDASGTLRLLKTLVDLGYVIRDDERKTYLPSARALFPLGLTHPIQEFRRDASHLLIDIQRATGATSALQIFLGGQRVVIDQRNESSRLTPFWGTTLTSAYHSSSSGKLYLSTLDENERRKLLGPDPLQSFTGATITTFEALQAEIEGSLARGFFTAREEAFAGMSSVAAPVRVPNGRIVGAMVATGTSGQLHGGKLMECGLHVKQAADMLSAMSPAVRALETFLGSSRRPVVPEQPAPTEPAATGETARRLRVSLEAKGPPIVS